MYKRLSKKERGFTLVELMVVIAIIALLAAILFPNLTKSIQKGRISALTSAARNMYTELSTYYADHGYYPLSSDNSSIDKSIISNTAKWPWGNDKVVDHLKTASISSDGSSEGAQQAILYITIPNPAAKVANEIASIQCSQINSNIEAPAVVIDLRSDAEQAVYLCKQ